MPLLVKPHSELPAKEGAGEAAQEEEDGERADQELQMPLLGVQEGLRLSFGVKSSHACQARRRNKERTQAAAGNSFITKKDIIDAELKGEELPKINLNLPPNYLEVTLASFRRRRSLSSSARSSINQRLTGITTNDAL